MTANASHSPRSDVHPPVDRDWTLHEQYADETLQDAQRLVSSAGSVERAKEAIEEAAKSEQARTIEEPAPDRFAGEMGFTSYLELFESSTPLSSGDGKAWFLTRVPGDQWVVWNDRDQTVAGRYATQEEALSEFTSPR
jgi:hypothetical protein